MNLFKIGEITLNMDRVNGIRDHHVPDGSEGADGEPVVRVMFEHSHVDLRGSEAHVLRRWIRHNARNLTIRRSVDGEDLISPEEQLQKAADSLLGLIDRARPKDWAVRSAAHHLAELMEAYVTGQLHHVPAQTFERSVITPPPEPTSADGSTTP